MVLPLPHGGCRWTGHRELEPVGPEHPGHPGGQGRNQGPGRRAGMRGEERAGRVESGLLEKEQGADGAAGWPAERGEEVGRRKMLAAGRVIEHALRASSC